MTESEIEYERALKQELAAISAMHDKLAELIIRRLVEFYSMFTPAPFVYPLEDLPGDVRQKIID